MSDKPDFTETKREGFELSSMGELVSNAFKDAKAKLKIIQDAGDSISIGNMFDMQLLMNRLSQTSEMCSNMMSSLNTAINSMARNIK